MYKSAKKLSIFVAVMVFLCFSGTSVFAASEELVKIYGESFNGSQHSSENGEGIFSQLALEPSSRAGNILAYGAESQEGDYSGYSNGIYGTETQEAGAYGPVRTITVSGADEAVKAYSDTNSPVKVDVAKKVGNWIYYNKSFYNYGMTRIQKSDKSKRMVYPDATVNMVVSGQWVYYNNADDGEKLYRVKNDGTGKKKVTDEILGNFRISGDWIIYTDRSKNDALYRIKSDGTGKKATVLSVKNVSNFTVAGNYILYNNPNDKYKLYIVNIDGKGNKKLVDSEIYPYDVTYADGWFFFKDYSNKSKYMKVKADGTGKSVVVNDTVASVGVSAGWVYYTSKAKNYSLFRVKYDGKSVSKALGTEVGQFRIDGSYIYYADTKGTTISRVKTDGSGKLKICSFDGYGFEVYNGYIHFYSYKENSRVRVKADGKQKIEKITTEQYQIDRDKTNNKWVWTSSRTVTSSLYGIDAAGTKKVIVDGNNYSYTLWGNYVYYMDREGTLYRSKLDGTGKTQLYKGNIVSFTIDKDWVYVSAWDSTYSQQEVYRIKAEGSVASQKISIPNADSVTVYNGWLYYMDGSSALSRKNLDSGAEEKLSDNVYTWRLANGYVFYSTKEDGTLYGRAADGNGPIVILQNETDAVVVAEQWIFYNNLADNGFIYKVRYDGSEKTKVTEKEVYLDSAKMTADYMFYMDYKTGNVMKINLDGSGESAVITDKAYGYKIGGNKIYYTLSGAKGIFSVNLDGTGKAKIANDLESYLYYNVAGDWVFFYKNEAYKGNTFRIKPGMSAPEKL